MTPKQARFVEEYLVDLNATQAAIRTGYSEKTAYAQGQRLLKNVEVSAAISLAIERRSQRTGITADRVLEEFARIGFANIRDVVKWSEDGVRLVPSDLLPEGVSASVSEISQTSTGDLKVKMHSKPAALDKMGQQLGMFIKRHEHAVKRFEEMTEAELIEFLGEEEKT